MRWIPAVVLVVGGCKDEPAEHTRPSESLSERSHAPYRDCSSELSEGGVPTGAQQYDGYGWLVDQESRGQPYRQITHERVDERVVRAEIHDFGEKAFITETYDEHEHLLDSVSVSETGRLLDEASYELAHRGDVLNGWTEGAEVGALDDCENLLSISRAGNDLMVGTYDYAAFCRLIGAVNRYDTATLALGFDDEGRLERVSVDGGEPTVYVWDCP